MDIADLALSCVPRVYVNYIKAAVASYIPFLANTVHLRKCHVQILDKVSSSPVNCRALHLSADQVSAQCRSVRELQVLPSPEACAPVGTGTQRPATPQACPCSSARAVRGTSTTP